MGNLAEVVVNQVIGAVLGTVVSLLVSWYFYKKADLPARVYGEMVENMLLMNIQSRLGDNLLFYENPHPVFLPKDKDTPHIVKFWYSESNPKQGESIIVLFRVADDGMNFPGSQFIEVTETSSMLSFPVARQGHGYYACNVDFPNNAPIGQHTITFKLTDKKSKSHTQSIKIDVKSRK